MKIQYQNGNIRIDFDTQTGVKLLEYEGEPNPASPVHLDVKITNWCNNPICGDWCHEQSNTRGKHGDLKALFEYLYLLPPGTEIALGGGNTLAHPFLRDFLALCKTRGWVCNLTVNSFHVNERTISLLIDLQNRGLIYGVGVSFLEQHYGAYELLDASGLRHVVIHMILGIHSWEQVLAMANVFRFPILLLGYKSWGNGISFGVPQEELDRWYWGINNLLLAKAPIIFDNLAAKQLNMRRFFTQKEWDTWYLGDDGKISMYVDGVTQRCAPSSTQDRAPWGETVITDWEWIKNGTGV